MELQTVSNTLVPYGGDLSDPRLPTSGDTTCSLTSECLCPALTKDLFLKVPLFSNRHTIKAFEKKGTHAHLEINFVFTAVTVQ